MNNKFLITVIIPTAEMEFDVYVPNCRKIGTIKKFILSAISDLTDKVYDRSFESVRLIDRNTAIEYDNNMLLKDTDIKNGTKIVIL